MIGSNRDSLCMNILRAKYKISMAWLQSDPPKAASPIWRAIEDAKKVIVKGACYTIGDGTSINVWIDPWVPWIQGFIPTPKEGVLTQPSFKVSQLFDPDLHSWKTNLIRELFDPSSAQAILSLPIPFRPSQDKLLWVPNSKGCFTVKSAYQTAHDLSSPQPPSENHWKLIWRLNLPERTKMLLWRIAANVLPTRDNLSKRMTIRETCCTICKQEKESPCHLFLNCPVAKVLWFTACWGFKANEYSIINPVDIVKLVIDPPKAVCQVCDKWLISLNMALTLEEIWNLRNLALHHGSPIDLLSSIRSIRIKFNELSLALAIPAPGHTHAHQSSWSLPPPDWIKINADAALSTTHASLVVVARDHLGVPIKIWARIIKVTSPLVAESEALLWATQLAAKEGWNQVIFEGDAKACFDAVNSPDLSPPWAIKTTTDNILSVRSSFMFSTFNWVRRSCNCLAHHVAKFSLCSLSSLFFNKDNLPPAFVALCKEDYPFCSSFLS